MKASDSFIDEVTIRIAAGRGGDGCVNMRREKFVPRGGPDGGDGGRGGDVVMRADRNLATLLDPRLRREYRAGDGAPGSGRNRSGRDGGSIEIRVPVGTGVHDLDRDALLADLVSDGQSIRLARGGWGGRGNARFATSTRQTPDFAEPGRPGEARHLRLSLRLLADVGLMGLPNAGKSTLLRRISKARPRVANYPFTTLVPSLGVVEVDERRFAVADIPGLIEGAHRGAGLGDRFLRHIERTRVLVHLIDAGSALPLGGDPIASYEAIRKELGAYDPALLERQELVALGKVDLLSDRTALEPLERELRRRGREVFRISGATGEGVDELLRAIAGELTRAEAAA